MATMGGPRRFIRWCRSSRHRSMAWPWGTASSWRSGRVGCWSNESGDPGGSSTRGSRGVWTLSRTRGELGSRLAPPGVMLQRKEGEWRVHDFPNRGRLRGGWVDSASRALFVGDIGSIIRWRNGRARREVSGTNRTLTGVWGTTGGSAYAVGLGGTVLHYDGSAWNPVSLPTQRSWHGVWGVADGSGEVWVVGASPVSYRYDGHVWNAVSTDALLSSVWARSRDTVFAVGPGGLVLRYDGSRWTQERSVRNDMLMAVSGSDETVVAVSRAGTIIERTGGTWRKVYDGGRTSGTDRCEP